MVKEFECGAQVDAGDSAQLAAVVTRLADDGAYWRRQSENAREMIERRFSRARALRKWSRLIAEVDAAAGQQTTERVA